MTEMEIIANGESIAPLTPDEKGQAQMQLSLPKEVYVLCLFWDEAGNLAVGNPIYVRNPPFLNDHFRARVTLDVKRNGRGHGASILPTNARNRWPLKEKSTVKSIP